MDYFIRIKDGQPFEHPIAEENLIQAFPDIDLNNLPNDLVKFVKTPIPTLGTYEVYEGVLGYQWNGEAYTEIHNVRIMTQEERQQKIDAALLRKPGPDWTLDLNTLVWIGPQPPSTGGPWKFDTTIKKWIHAPNPPFPSWVLREDGLTWKAPAERPKDGSLYRWEESTTSWVRIRPLS